MRFRLSLLAGSIAVLTGICIGAVAANTATTTKAVSSNHSSTKTVKSKQNLSQPFVNMARMVRHLEGVQYKNVKADDIGLRFYYFILQLKDIEMNKFMLDSKTYALHSKADELQILPTPALIKKAGPEKKDIKLLHDVFPITFKDVDYQHDMQRMQGLWLGKGTSDIKSINFGKYAELQNIDSKISATTFLGRVQYSVQYEIDKIKSDYGQDYTAGPLKVDASVNFDAKAFAKWMHFNKQVNRLFIKHPDLEKNNAAAKKLLAKTDAARNVMLAQGAKLTINNFSYQQGKDGVYITGTVVLPKVKQVNNAKYSTDVMMKSIYANLHVKVSEAFVDRSIASVAKAVQNSNQSKQSNSAKSKSNSAKTMLAAAKVFIGVAEDEGYIYDKNGSYVTNIVLKDGVLTLNGHKINLNDKKKSSHGGRSHKVTLSSKSQIQSNF